MDTTRVLLGCSIVAIASMILLANSINGKEKERKMLNTSPVVREQGVEARSEEWARYYPRQYETWKQTSESVKIDDKLKKKPQLAVLWAGYGFASDDNAPRGHVYALQDNINTLRTGAPVSPTTGPSPTACWSCKSPDIPRLIGQIGEQEYFTGKWARFGSEVVNSVGCADCHDSRTGNLVLSRPWLKKGLESSGVRLDRIPHQQMRSLVCAQCHSEYYFQKGEETGANGGKRVVNTVTFPWANGFKGENIEEYYDLTGFSDWIHAISKAPMLKAQHPDYELYTAGIHGRRDVACADCHMPFMRDGGLKISDHWIRSPLTNLNNACQTCHNIPEEELYDRVMTIQTNTAGLLRTTEAAILDAIDAIMAAMDAGATDEQLAEARQYHRAASLRWDFVSSENSTGFHSPQEAARVLANAIDNARLAQISANEVLNTLQGSTVSDTTTGPQAGGA